jgi:hypothetical protein
MGRKHTFLKIVSALTTEGRRMGKGFFEREHLCALGASVVKKTESISRRPTPVFHRRSRKGYIPCRPVSPVSNRPGPTGKSAIRQSLALLEPVSSEDRGIGTEECFICIPMSTFLCLAHRSVRAAGESPSLSPRLIRVQSVFHLWLKKLTDVSTDTAALPPRLAAGSSSRRRCCDRDR